MAFVIGRDKYGQSIILWRVRLMDPKATTEERIQKFLFYTLDTALAQAAPGVDKYIIIADFGGAGMSNFKMKQVNKMIPIIQDYYAECLAKLYVVNIPFAIRAIWITIKIFLDKETIDKVLLNIKE
jgi:hypothetical protein